MSPLLVSLSAGPGSSDTYEISTDTWSLHLMNGHYEWIWICVDDSHYLSIRVERVDMLIRCSALSADRDF